jgi:hypothetical protein
MRSTPMDTANANISIRRVFVYLGTKISIVLNACADLTELFVI